MALKPLRHFVTDSNKALELKLVREVSDIEDDSCTFKPEMSHQVYGPQENIFGYANLRIQLYYSAGSLLTYLGIKYDDKLDPQQRDLVPADDPFGLLAPKLEPGFITNLDEFSAAITKDVDFKPCGELLHSFSVTESACGKSERTFEVYLCDITTPGFLSYHARIQTFLLWFVDASCYIDTDDERWVFFVVYEKYQNSSGSTLYASVGYSTVYRYYAYPMNIRPRISQMLILPPFQKKGIGAKLLKTIYSYFIQLNNVLDITVEDPSEDFKKLRDFVDAQHCMKLNSFAPDKLHNGFSKEMITEANQSYKINSKQARRIYEILRLKETNVSDNKQYKAYRVDVKRRLNIPYKKQQNIVDKLKKVLKPSEIASTNSLISSEERLERLSTEYNFLEEEYKQVIERIIAE